MKLVITALIACFAALPSAAEVTDLNRLSAAEIRENTSNIAIPEPASPEMVAELKAAGLTEADLREALQEPYPAVVNYSPIQAVLPRTGPDPVVITIPGLKFGEVGWGCFELKNILKFIKIFFRNKDVSESDIANGLVAFSPRYFFPEDEEDYQENSARSRLPDNYLEEKLKEIPGYASHDVVVIPFPWSRDPKDSAETVLLLQDRVAQIYDSYKATGRPVYILAHSWGSVLAHTALNRLAARRPDIKIDKFITAGSPLVPSNFVVRLFLKIEIRQEKLEREVRKPAIVRTWRNFWAHRDAYSNAIPAADSNYQADATVENVEPTLINLILHNKLLKKEARKDLFKIRDIKAWHGAYFFDYKAVLNSIQKEINVEVFRPAVAPQVVDCSKTPAVHMCRP